MENVQKTRRLFASAYGCKASRSFLIWGLSAAMSISVIPMMAEISVGEKNYDTQIVSQTKTITGTIIDETGEPMIGVSVLVQGTTTGAVTDLDGKFTLEVPANATLVVSYIGYKTQNVKVGSQNTFAIKMDGVPENEQIQYNTLSSAIEKAQQKKQFKKDQTMVSVRTSYSMRSTTSSVRSYMLSAVRYSTVRTCVS